MEIKASEIPHKETRDFLKKIEARGTWDIKRTGGGHIQLQHKATGKKVHTSSTPSDHRGFANTLALINQIDPPKLGRREALLKFLKENPNSSMRVDYISKNAFPDEYKVDKHRLRATVSKTLQNLSKSDKYPQLERPKKGTYLWKVEDSTLKLKYDDALHGYPDDPEPWPELDKIVEEQQEIEPSFKVTKTSIVQETRELELFEEVKRLTSGALVLEDSKGNLYVAKQLEIPQWLLEGEVPK